MPITNLVKVGVCVDCIALATVTFCVFCFGSLLYLPSLFFYSFLGDPKTVWFLSLSFFLSFVLEVSFIFHLCFSTAFLEILKQFDSCPYLGAFLSSVLAVFHLCFSSVVMDSFLFLPKKRFFILIQELQLLLGLCRVHCLPRQSSSLHGALHQSGDMRAHAQHGI